MPGPSRNKQARERARADRARLRQGLRAIEIWVPDVRTRSFKAEARKQSLTVARSPYAKADQDFIDAISDRSGFWETE